MDDLLNLAAKKDIEGFKKVLKQACSLKFDIAREDIRKDIGKSVVNLSDN